MAVEQEGGDEAVINADVAAFQSERPAGLRPEDLGIDPHYRRLSDRDDDRQCDEWEPEPPVFLSAAARRLSGE